MRSTILPLVATLFAFTVTARAEDAPKKPSEPAKTEVAKPVGKKVNIEELGEMLDGLGYNPKPTKNKDGNVDGYNLEFQTGTWTMRMFIDISDNQSEICVSAQIFKMVEGEDVPMAAMLELLAENGLVFPSTVYYVKSTKQFRVYASYKNEKITNGNLRTKLDGFSDTVKQVVTKFNQAKQATTDVVPAPAPAR